MSDARFLTGSTMGQVVRITATGAFGMPFYFLVAAVKLCLAVPSGRGTIGCGDRIRFRNTVFSVSAGVRLMMMSTALVSRNIGAGSLEQARRW